MKTAGGSSLMTNAYFWKQKYSNITRVLAFIPVFHWSEDVALVGSSMAAMKVVSATSGGGLVGMAAFQFQGQWIYTMTIFPHPLMDAIVIDFGAINMLSYFTMFSIVVVKTDSEPVMVHFIYINVHADDNVLWLMCHVGSLCVNKILIN